MADMDKPKWLPIREGIDTLDDGYWTWYRRKGGLPRGYHDLLEEVRVTGKYLFFSEDRSRLESIALDEIANRGFREAKVNNEGTNIGKDYVLCLYYRNDSRKQELADRYRSFQGVRYRYWKSDEDTRQGKYSEEFLGKLSPEEKEAFTRREA